MYYPEQKDFGSQLRALKGKRVVVLGHMRPDGDCIGSQVAMTRVLRAIGVDAVAVNMHEAPRVLKQFVGDTPYIVADDFKDEGHTCITLDCADLMRIGKDLTEIYTKPWMCIDHHLSNGGYAQNNIIDASACATAEILATLFYEHDLPIDPITAQALYIGIATDTGQFRYSSTTQHVFEVTAKLIGDGASAVEANNALYEQESWAKIQLLKDFLNSMTMELDNRVCIGRIPNGTYAKYGATIDDSEGLVEYARSIDSVVIGALLEERGDILKGSLRAKEQVIRVDQLAGEMGGGGHACAAGFSVNMSLEEFYPIFIDRVKKHLATVAP